MLAIGETKLLSLSNEFPRLFKHACDLAVSSLLKSEESRKAAGLDLTELKGQLESMRKFYLQPQSSVATPRYDDEICEVLLAIDALASALDEILNSPIPPRGDWNKLRELVSAKTNGRIGRYDTPNSLTDRLKELFKASGQTKDLWITHDGSHTEHFEKCKAEYHLREARITKFRIWKLLMTRTIELNTLHSSSALGTTKSGQLLGSVKRGRRKIDAEIKKYNSLLEKLPPSHPPLAPLDKKAVNEMLLTDGFWELERFQSTEKWAVNPEVRNAINKRQLRDRAIEEVRILAAELHRLVEYCSSRLDAVMHALRVVQANSTVGMRLLEIGINTCNILYNLHGVDLLANHRNLNDNSVKEIVVRASKRVGEVLASWESEAGLSSLTRLCKSDLGNESIEVLATQMALDEDIYEDNEDLFSGSDEDSETI
jgi:hypothetical protein